MDLDSEAGYMFVGQAERADPDLKKSSFHEYAEILKGKLVLSKLVDYPQLFEMDPGGELNGVRKATEEDLRSIPELAADVELMKAAADKIKSGAEGDQLNPFRGNSVASMYMMAMEILWPKAGDGGFVKQADKNFQNQEIGLLTEVAGGDAYGRFLELATAEMVVVDWAKNDSHEPIQAGTVKLANEIARVAIEVVSQVEEGATEEGKKKIGGMIDKCLAMQKSIIAGTDGSNAKFELMVKNRGKFWEADNKNPT